MAIDHSHPNPSYRMAWPGTLHILDEAEDWIVVNKPAGLLIHPSNPTPDPTLWNELQALLAYEVANGGQISFINRLDRETSGIVLVAKHKRAARKLSQLMQRRQVEKRYLALVWGWPAEEIYCIDGPILRQGEKLESAVYLKRMIHPAGQPAFTTVRMIRRFKKDTSNGSRFALVEATPHTGRMHQIRVHLASIGHPVVGDKIYGQCESWYLRFIESGWTPELQAALLLPRHALHSCRLAIPDALVPMAWKCGLPPDLAAFMVPEG